MIIVNCEQGGEQWFAEKLGKPSASNASKIVTTNGEPSKQRTDYLYSLASEIITGTKIDGYKSKDMEEGNEREAQSRAHYELMTGKEVEQVGLVYKDKKRLFLCSPDGIIDSKEGLELKNPLPKTQVKRLIEGKLPTEYFSQVQFSLLVTGFEVWNFMSFCPDMPELILKVERDEKFIKKLHSELVAFCEELEEIVNKIK